MNPPTRAVAGDGPDGGHASGRGTICLSSPETASQRSPVHAAACSQLPSSAPPRLTLKTDGSLVESSNESYIYIQELPLLLLHLQAAASIFLFSVLACLLAGRSSWCCCLTLGFHCFVSCYCSCSIVWSLVPVNSLQLHSIRRHSFILGIDREQHV